MLRTLRGRGPLRSREIEDRAQVPWSTGGWNDGKNVGRMLDILWFAGRIGIVGRHGNQRIWDIAEHVYPIDAPRLPRSAVAEAILERQLAARGVARIGEFGLRVRRPPARLGAGVAAHWCAGASHGRRQSGRCRASGTRMGRRSNGPGAPRTTLLSPFDRLIHDRERTRRLFEFEYRLEMYVPGAQRRHGYYVLPVLHGDRLVGRIDPFHDRVAGTLIVHTVHAEPDAPAGAGEPLAAAIRDLAGWVGAEAVELPGTLPGRMVASPPAGGRTVSGTALLVVDLQIEVVDHPATYAWGANAGRGRQAARRRPSGGRSGHPHATRRG